MLTVRDASSRLREVERIEFTVFIPHDVDSRIPQEFHPSLAVSPPHTFMAKRPPLNSLNGRFTLR